jgi:hypothetical protein
MVWLKKKDGRGWTSNRTRDVIDYAFTVSNNTPCKVEIRKSWRPNGRANNTFASLTFETPEIAKATIEHLVNTVRDCFDTQTEGRKWFLETMLAKCVDDGRAEVWMPNSSNTSSVRVGKMGYTPPATPPPLTAITPPRVIAPTWPAKPTAEDVEEMINIITETFSAADEATVEPEIVEPVIVQQPKTIVINGKEIQIGWPQ